MELLVLDRKDWKTTRVLLDFGSLNDAQAQGQFFLSVGGEND